MYNNNYNFTNHHDNEAHFHDSGNSSNAYGYNRQDSLAEAANLVERDRGHNMINFMDEQIVICDYIESTGIRIGREPEVDYDLNDYLKVEDCSGYSGYDNTFGNEPAMEYEASAYEVMEDQAPESVPVPCPVQVPGQVRIKSEVQEPEYEEEKPFTDFTDRPIRRSRNYRNTSVELEKFTPKTKARKYVLKNDNEKSTEEYRLKRAKNNDAVRKSRCKQKSEQQKCMDEKQILEQKYRDISIENEKLKEEVRTLKEIVSQKDEQLKFMY